MLGYGIHELFSYFKAAEIWDASSPIYTKLYDFSGTILDHKEGILGIPLYALIGWYSKPEIIQFVLQYTYTGLLLFYFFRQRKLQSQK
jgi:high-affinity iron transporter